MNLRMKIKINLNYFLEEIKLSMMDQNQYLKAIGQ